MRIPGKMAYRVTSTFEVLLVQYFLGRIKNMNLELQMHKDDNVQEWMGSRFDLLLKDKNISKRQMANVLEVSPSQITRMCAGSALIMPEKLSKIQRTYHVDLTYFVARDLSCTMYMKEILQQKNRLDYLVDNIIIEMEKSDPVDVDNCFCRIINGYLSSRGLAMCLSPLHSINAKEMLESKKYS